MSCPKPSTSNCPALVLTPADIIGALARGPELVSGLLASVPPQDLKRRPQPGRWSAHEHACHLAVMEPMWATRVERILDEDCPTIISYEPEDEDPDRLLRMDLTATLAAFHAARQQLVGRLRQLPEEDWLRPAIHTAHSRYSLFLMCRHMTLHDGLHAYRIEESALGSHWPGEHPGP